MQLNVTSALSPLMKNLLPSLRLKMNLYMCLVLLSLLAVCRSDIIAVSSCEQSVTQSYLDLAVEMITKAKDKIPTSDKCGHNLTRGALDCSELFEMGYNKSGVHTIWPVSRITEEKSLEVYCDMQTNGGGWTVIQRRGDFGRPNDYFFKDWKSYKEGFGDIQTDFWLGNDIIFALTNQKLYSARVDLTDVKENTAYADYGTFWIDDENHFYTLHIDDYSGTAGDSLAPHNNMNFSTKDQDNDKSKDNSCAQTYKGGWWYAGCHASNLNGMYIKGENNSTGVAWRHWKNSYESLESTEIKIRPKKFNPQHAPLNTPL